jgi:hypothetical protein
VSTSTIGVSILPDWALTELGAASDVSIYAASAGNANLGQSIHELWIRFGKTGEQLSVTVVWDNSDFRPQALVRSKQSRMIGIVPALSLAGPGCSNTPTSDNYA